MTTLHDSLRAVDAVRKQVADGDRSEQLEEAFRLFVSAARGLEDAFERLRVRGEEIDRKVHKVNVDLRKKVGALEQLRNRLGSVFEALPGGVIALGPDDRITLVNSAAEGILGIRGSEVVGAPVADLPLPEGTLLVQAGSDPDSGAVDGDGGRREIVNARGERRVVESRVELIRSEAGEEHGRVEILDDRTEVVDLQDRMARLDRLAALGEIAAGIAHEVRNPLHGSIGFADLLRKEIERTGGSDRALGYAEKIRRGIRKVDAIIESIMTWARPEAVETVSVDLRALIVDAAETVIPVSEDEPTHRIEIEDTGSPLRCEGDPVRLYRVVENLLKNAVEAMPDGGVVRVRFEVDGERTRIHVEDRGCGIDAEHLEKVFQPFFTTKGAGTGLGLFFTQRILDVHGGTLSLRNRRGGGLGATIELESSPASVPGEGGAR